jgi:glutamate-1-semialdehyde aminotransferase
VLTFAYGPDFPINAPFPVVMARINDIEGTRALIRANASTLAAILLEPRPATAGARLPETVVWRARKEGA